MSELRFAAFGAGFWARFQLAGWREIGGTTCVAIYNRTRSKAEALAREFDISAVYDDPEELLRNENLDFVDILTDVDSHARFVHLAAAHKLPAICQKPLEPSLEIAEEMVRTCAQAGVPLYVNENWRWQTPIREVSRILASREIGKPFRARLDMISGFPVYANQPFLKQLKQFILTDMGSHILDVARFLFGEARTLYCQTARVHADIQGEDVATVMLDMDSGVTVRIAGRSSGRTISAFGSQRRTARWSGKFRHRAFRGPIPPTTSCIPASCHARPTCCGRCAEKCKAKPVPTTI